MFNLKELECLHYLSKVTKVDSTVSLFGNLCFSQFEELIRLAVKRISAIVYQLHSQTT